MRLNRMKDKLFMLILSILIPVIVFEMFSINNYREQTIQNKLESNIHLSEAISNSFEEYINNLWVQTDIIVAYILNNPESDYEEISKYLNYIVDRHGTMQSLSWLDAHGTIIASSNPGVLGKSLRHSEYVAKIIEGESRVLSNLTKGLTGDRPILPIAQAVKRDGILTGIMVASINVEKMGSQFSSLLFDEDEVFKLIDKNGSIVYQNDVPGIYMSIRKISANSPTWDALEGNLVKAEKTFAEDEETYRIGCGYPIKKTGWALSIYSKYDNVLACVNEKTGKTIAIFEMLLLLSLLIALMAGDIIAAPMIKLKEAAYRIMNGDYTVRTNIAGHDEIAITAQTFDSMVESIEKYDTQKSQFFINLSHELKTPLNVILASLQLIDIIHDASEVCPNYNRISEQLSLMKQNCYRLVRTVSNIIDLSKHDHGYLTLKLRNCNIISIIEDVTMSIVKYAEHKKIELLFDTDTEEKIIACDPDAIERIMLNLISNALKFTKEGGNIIVSISDKNDRILVSVRDTGIGIPEDKLEYIFERFTQLDSSLCRNYEGSGIGLSLVKALVESHNGIIFVNSVLNEGTEFVIELPAVLMEKEYALENGENEQHHDRIVEKINLEFSDVYGLKKPQF